MTSNSALWNYKFFYVSHCRIVSSLHLAVSNVHHHNIGELMFVVEGESVIMCDGTVMHICAPYIAYYPAGAVHQQHNNYGSVYDRWCFPIFPADIGGSTGLPENFFTIPLNAEQCEQLAVYVRIMYSYWGAADNTRPSEAMATNFRDSVRLKYLLLLFLNELRPLIPDAVSAKSTYINDVCLYINEHSDERLTLDALADRFFVGRTTLTKDFRRTMDMSVVEFITMVRVNRAKALIGDGLPLGEVADRCGFSSVSYFIKVFSRHTGLSPGRYRDALEEPAME